MEVGGREYDILDFPEDGIHREGNIKYDLNSFNKFYDEYGEKFDVDFFEGTPKSGLNDTKIDGNPATFYAEAASELGLVYDLDFRGGATVRFTGNSDPSRRGTSFSPKTVSELDYLKTSYRKASEMHSHPPPGIYTYKHGNLNMEPRMRVRGPSPGDFNRAQYFQYRSVMVDNSYIYLYNRNRDMFIYRRK